MELEEVFIPATPQTLWVQQRPEGVHPLLLPRHAHPHQGQEGLEGFSTPFCKCAFMGGLLPVVPAPKCPGIACCPCAKLTLHALVMQTTLPLDQSLVLR